MTIKYFDRVSIGVTGTPGTGDCTLGSPVSTYQSFSAAGASDGDTFPYLIVDGTTWEFGVGTYHSSGPSVTRTTRNASSTGSAISFTSNAVVMATFRAEDVASGGGSSTLASLADVSVTSPAGGQVLTYDAGSGKWLNAAPSGGAHRYWRLRVVQLLRAVTGWGTAALAFRSAGGTLLSTGGTPIGYDETAASTFSIASAFDGSTASGHGWYYNNGSNYDTLASWIGYDFGSAVSVGKFEFSSLNGYVWTMPCAIAIDYSDDEVAWKEYCMFTCPAGADNTVQSFTLP